MTADAPADAARADVRVAAPEGGSRVRLVVILGLLTALGPFTGDMYLPALPAITDDFLTSDAAVQLTLTGTLLGLALGQLVIGPLSDVFGRRRPLVIGTSLHYPGTGRRPAPPPRSWGSRSSEPPR